jgi:hypothetical protein
MCTSNISALCVSQKNPIASSKFLVVTSAEASAGIVSAVVSESAGDA